MNITNYLSTPYVQSTTYTSKQQSIAKNTVAKASDSFAISLEAQQQKDVSEFMKDKPITAYNYEKYLKESPAKAAEYAAYVMENYDLFEKSDQWCIKQGYATGEELTAYVDELLFVDKATCIRSNMGGNETYLGMIKDIHEYGYGQEM